MNFCARLHFVDWYIHYGVQDGEIPVAPTFVPFRGED